MSKVRIVLYDNAYEKLQANPELDLLLALADEVKVNEHSTLLSWENLKWTYTIREVRHLIYSLYNMRRFELAVIEDNLKDSQLVQRGFHYNVLSLMKQHPLAEVR